MPAFAGSHQALPTLSWSGATVTETLPIASFVARRLGHYAGLDDAGVAAQEAIVSSCYLDVTLRLIEVIRADNPGADPVRSFATALPLVIRKLELAAQQLGSAPWFGSLAPTMPDFFLVEAVEALRHLLGPDQEARLHERLPYACGHDLRIRERPALERAWLARPAAFTARNDELAILARLRSTELSFEAA